MSLVGCCVPNFDTGEAFSGPVEFPVWPICHTRRGGFPCDGKRLSLDLLMIWSGCSSPTMLYTWVHSFNFGFAPRGATSLPLSIRELSELPLSFGAVVSTTLANFDLKPVSPCSLLLHYGRPAVFDAWNSQVCSFQATGRIERDRFC